MRSGKTDAYHEEVQDYVRELPPEQRPAVRLATHIEVKVAVRMRNQGLTEETVVIDRSVCGTRDFDKNDPWTCDKLLETSFLERGSKLHIIVPGLGMVTYIGKEEGR
jgi:hypothetical protein